MIAKINHPSLESVELALHFLNSVNNDDFSKAHTNESYFLAGGMFDHFNELKVYLSSLSTAHEKITNIEAFEVLSGMAYDKLKIDLGLVH
jgi:hypothetical protein